MHIIEVHETAVRATIPVVARIQPPDLSRPTPCAEWDLAQLLAHMTAQHRGFAAAAAGTGGDPEVWQLRPLGDDPVRDYARAAESVIAAFAAPGVLDRSLLLPEITPRPVPGRLVIGFHLVDYVVHGWDVARSRGVDFRLPDHVVAAALPLALAVPDGEFRAVDGSPFARAIPAAEPLSDIDRILTHLGRCPSWTTPAAEEGSVG
jgi:uncharacterized protein (TIGR03086 family)